MSGAAPGAAASTPAWDRISVLGLGLLGGSIAAGARERRLAREVVGCGRRRAPLEAARARGLVDRITTDPAAAVAGADLIILATPVGSMAAVLRAAAPALAPGAIVTDVGSVKGSLAETLPGLLPPGVTYIGSHPMAGSHERGAEHASADLLEGAVCVVTREPGDAAPGSQEAHGAHEPHERLEQFWRALGARIERRDPAGHDLEVAWISHVPHAVAFAFARALQEAPKGARALSGAGFRDFTRIARSAPELWADILLANAKALSGPMGAVSRGLSELAAALESEDFEAVERLLVQAGVALGSVEDAVDGRRGREDEGS